MTTEQYEQGIVTTVDEYPAGDELLADAPQTARTNLDTDPRALLVASSTWNMLAGTDGTNTATSEINQVDGPPGVVDSYRKAVQTAPQTGGSAGMQHRFTLSGGAGDSVHLGCWFYASRTMTGTTHVRTYNVSTVVSTVAIPTTLVAGQWLWVSGLVVSANVYDNVRIWFVPDSASLQQTGDVFKMTGGLVEWTTVTGGYFDGDTPDTPGVDHAWTGAARASTSTQTTGASVLALNDACDFNETGGQGQLVGEATTEVFAYTAADLDADTLTLAAPLAAAWPAGVPVQVVPAAVERRAMVQIEDQGEGVDSRVPHALYDRLPLGSRDAETGEWVTLSLDGAEWVVADVLAREPLIDASFIDPDTVPPGGFTDGEAPAASPAPTVIGGIGALFARWTAPDNPDPLTYQVHISPTSGFTPDATTLVAETPATSVTIRKLPTAVGVPPTDVLQYGVPYYVRIVAVDADGPGPFGAQGSDQMVPVNSPDIAANAILANHLVANQITGDKLAANLILGSKISTGSLDTSVDPPVIVGQRVELDPTGLQVITQAGTPVITLPTDPGQAAKFEGDIVARGLTVTRAADIISGAALTMATSAPDPKLAPTLAVDWESVTLQPVSRPSYNPGSGASLGTFALVGSEVTCIAESGTANVLLVAQARSASQSPDGVSGTRVWFYNLTSGQNVQVGGAWFFDSVFNIYGATYLGGKPWYLASYAGAWYLHDPTQPGAWTENTYTRLNANETPALGNDGANLIVAENDPTGVLKVRTLGAFNTSGATMPPVTITATDTYGAGTGTGYANTYVGKGAFDFGASKVVVGRRASGTTTYVMATAAGSVRDAALEFPPGTSNRRGMVYTGGAFYTLGGDGVLRKHTALTLADGLTQWWAAVTWRDTQGTLHETKPGPLSSLTMVRRARLKVTTPPVPTGAGGVEDPNAWALYMTKVASGTPATTALRYQTQALATAPVVYVSTVATGGAAPPTINNFAGGGQFGVIQSQAVRLDNTPKTYLDGSGKANVDGLVPPGTVLDYGGAAAPAGWLPCDGSAVSRTLYPDLFAAVGTRYGTGNGTTTFNLPTSNAPLLASGTVDITIAASTIGTAAITYGVTFAAAPRFVAMVTGASSYFAFTTVQPGTSGVTVGAKHYNDVSSTATVPVHWHAIGASAYHTQIIKT